MGALCRYWIGLVASERWPGTFPTGIFLINASGSLVLGLLYGLGSVKGPLPPGLALGLGVGFLGAYTTFSTWSVDTLRLIQGGLLHQAALNIFGSVAAGLLAAWIGYLSGSMVARSLG